MTHVRKQSRLIVQSLPTTAYATNEQDRSSSRCRPCTTLYDKERGKDQRVRKKKHAAALATISNKRKMVSDLKEATACMDCKQKFPSCAMQFDHRDQPTKVATIGQLIPTASLEVLLTEIDKCDIVCANCHAIRTQTKGQNKYRRSKVQPR